ncbi:MAG: tyrosine-type recombinase/integrase, partial [Thiolinea sp.]
AWKVHWTQVAPDMVTREFAEIRDRLGICSELEPVQRPSFHEIRALGADLYRQAGYPEEWIQSLLGHEDREMTAKYLAGHGHIEVITVPNLEKV